ncbi:aminotransferase [Allosaccharopolyspora coralli]|uniref:Aminotransferase n=1 Tax=Allosaccharopolyspora coralli TaxID=2665642 RepID=A0A5Q3QHF1_9PSEU|nr:aminotransferase class V-fold PLP-dependent enzyme [Allosaccharopolyspora coralli]QGK70955.1 aminotransferase [Allosaccharopolyspora coralli]
MREAFGATFDVPEGYLDTASIGIPPTVTADAMTETVRRWGSGLDGAGDFVDAADTARAAFGSLIGVPADRVAAGATVSQLVGLVAASLPADTTVLAAAQEFPSVTFPFAVQQRRGVRLTEVGLGELPARVAEHDLVVASVVQANNGRIVDLDALRVAAQAGGTRVLLDVTQAAGWLPLQLEWADFVVGTAYKWLLSPRGSAWMALRPDARALVAPLCANWYSVPDRDAATEGLPARIAEGAHGLDLSPSWFAHVGAATSMSWLLKVDRESVRRHCVGLVDVLREELGQSPAGSAITAVDVPEAHEKLAAAGIAHSVRAGAVRLAFHMYNTVDDVERVMRVLRSA